MLPKRFMMKNAGKEYKKRVVDILALSFQDNRSVNYIIPQDSTRRQRIRKLMAYSFDVCHQFGEVFITDDENACALILLPDKKKTSLRSLWRDLKFTISCIGVANVGKALRREAEIKKRQPLTPLYYLWFIGVDPNVQGRGIGSQLLESVIRESERQKRLLCLETSAIKNLAWYPRFGFVVYNKLD